MNSLRFKIIIGIMLFVRMVNAQIGFNISTDKDIYESGETIIITCRVTNNSDSTINMLLPNWNSCQAEFKFDDYFSYRWTTCFATAQEISLQPNQTRVYNWSLIPQKFGIPNRDGVHKIIGYFSYNLEPYSDYIQIGLRDSIFINAPMFLGGQLNVGFEEPNDSIVTNLKDSINAQTLFRDEYPWGITETWQIKGTHIDSLFNNLNNDHRLDWVEYNRRIAYDSISTLTSVDLAEYHNKIFYLSNAYPNPFNSTSSFNIELPKTDNINIELINTLGEKVYTIYSGSLKGKIRYRFQVDASNLSSGTYYYSVKSSDYQNIKKIILLK